MREVSAPAAYQAGGVAGLWVRDEVMEKLVSAAGTAGTWAELDFGRTLGSVTGGGAEGAADVTAGVLDGGVGCVGGLL